MQNTEKTPIEESAGFIAAWEAPITEPRAPRVDLPETPGFIAAWEAPLTKQPARPDWREWKRPACEISEEEAASLNTFYSGVEA